MSIHALINTFTIVSSIFLIISLFIYFIDKNRLHFLLVNIILLSFNLLITYLDSSIELKTPIENKELLTYLLSTITIVSQVNFINKELEFNSFIKKRSYNTFIISLLIGLIILFILPLTITKDITLAKELFLYPTISFGLLFTPYFLSNSYKILFRLPINQNKKLNNIVAIFSIIGMFLFSLLQFFYNEFSNTFLNIYTYSFSVLYIYNWLTQVKQIPITEEAQNKSEKNLSRGEIIKIMTDLELSPSEQDVTFAIINNPNASYKVIGEELFSQKNTISKHASNCFKKANVSSKEDYLSLFQ